MPGCNGTVTANGNSYKYMEVSYGTQRGISIALQGTAGSSYEFKLSPNPHNSKAYNKKQSKFYEEIATEIAGQWPPTVGTKVTGLGIEYTLTTR